MATNGQWIGLKEANAALRKLPEYARVGVQKEMNTTAFQVQRLAEAKAPESADGSHGRPPGFLRAMIVWQSRPRSLSAVVGVGPDAYYWKFLEFGTSRLQARPFFRPAAEAMRADHDTRMMKALTEAANQVERGASSSRFL